MALRYRFKKERLADGTTVMRPIVPVTLHGDRGSLSLFALIDSGCDTTVVPENVAQRIGLRFGNSTELFAFRESTAAAQSQGNLSFIGKARRSTERIANVPIVIALGGEEEDVVLGVAGIFDAFDIGFQKTQNRITLKRVRSI